MITYLKNLEYKDGKLLRNGKRAGYVAPNGYRKIMINYKNYYEHRLIFEMHYGEPQEEIDHINGNRSDNRIENLRIATRSQQNQNTKMRSDNTSGVKGVFWHNKAQKWQVTVQKMYFGIFDDLELASLVAAEARDKYHGEYARHA